MQMRIEQQKQMYLRGPMPGQMMGQMAPGMAPGMQMGMPPHMAGYMPAHQQQQQQLQQHAGQYGMGQPVMPPFGHEGQPGLGGGVPPPYNVGPSYPLPNPNGPVAHGPYGMHGMPGYQYPPQMSQHGVMYVTNPQQQQQQQVSYRLRTLIINIM